MTTFRTDGLDSPLSINGGTQLFFVRHVEGGRSGPFGCLREAELATKNDDDMIVDQHGRDQSE